MNTMFLKTKNFLLQIYTAICKFEFEKFKETKFGFDLTFSV